MILQHLLRREELRAEVTSEPVPLLVDSVDVVLQVAFLIFGERKRNETDSQDLFVICRSLSNTIRLTLNPSVKDSTDFWTK